MVDPDVLEIASDEAEAHRLQGALQAITPPALVPETDSINSKIRDALRRDSVQRRRWMRPLLAMTSVAAVLLVGLLLVSLLNSGHASAAVAWADVVKAMGQVDAVHAFEYWEGPDRNSSKRVDRVDEFYRRPGLWRGQGFDCVHFLTSEGERLYDVRKRQFIDPKSVLIKPLNVPEAKRFKDGPLLDSVVDMLFDGKIPEPKHVELGPRELQADLELFEYAAPANPNQLVRIRVAKASRLPVRIDLIDRRDGSGIYVHLEYGPALPLEAFNADAFAATVERRKLTHPADIFAVGLEGTK